MKKNILIPSIVLLATFAAALVLPAVQAWPESYPGPDNNCTCYHYNNHQYVNQYPDEYTGCGLTGYYYDTTKYSLGGWSWERGYYTGGTGNLPTGDMWCGYNGNEFDVNPNNWYLDGDNYWKQDWGYTDNYGSNGPAILSAYCISYFMLPGVPGSYWECGVPPNGTTTYVWVS